jgi:hypothetical protein
MASTVGREDRDAGRLAGAYEGSAEGVGAEVSEHALVEAAVFAGDAFDDGLKQDLGNGDEAARARLGPRLSRAPSASDTTPRNARPSPSSLWLWKW